MLHMVHTSEWGYVLQEANNNKIGRPKNNMEILQSYNAIYLKLGPVKISLTLEIYCKLHLLVGYATSVLVWVVTVVNESRNGPAPNKFALLNRSSLCF